MTSKVIQAAKCVKKNERSKSSYVVANTFSKPSVRTLEQHPCCVLAVGFEEVFTPRLMKNFKNVKLKKCGKGEVSESSVTFMR